SLLAPNANARTTRLPLQRVRGSTPVRGAFQVRCMRIGWFTFINEILVNVVAAASDRGSVRGRAQGWRDGFRSLLNQAGWPLDLAPRSHAYLGLFRGLLGLR